MSDEARLGVIRLADQWSICLPGGVAERIAQFSHQLLLWNERVNLTGSRTIGDLLGQHLPDSFALSRLVPEGSKVVDVGSGGGLPAVPFAILRQDCHVTLVEPRAKRVAFLNAAVRACGCTSVAVFRGRMEDLVKPRFSVATSRATFPPEEWLRLAPGLLLPGGRVVVLTTSQPRNGTAGMNVLGSVEYQTAEGISRWAGCYCFT
jgi:16S rRNA (guanine527-N7)-methyltransferase